MFFLKACCHLFVHMKNVFVRWENTNIITNGFKSFCGFFSSTKKKKNRFFDFSKKVQVAGNDYVISQVQSKKRFHINTLD